jgi:hypothetical protein
LIKNQGAKFATARRYADKVSPLRYDWEDAEAHRRKNSIPGDDLILGVAPTIVSIIAHGGSMSR